MNSGAQVLAIDSTEFTTLIQELARRGHGTRESGAFLLGAVTTNNTVPPPPRRQIVSSVAYYDDLDPNCLTGGITFGSTGYSALTALCRREQVRVIGDIHTHPHLRIGQSPTDAGHPMVALPGHIALIAPNYAQGTIRPHDLSAHLFLGQGQWTSTFGEDVDRLLQVTDVAGHRNGSIRVLRYLSRRIGSRPTTRWRSR